MNAHIHLMEAFTTLYEAKAEPRVEARLREVFRICRDAMIVDPPGCMNQFFTPDWRPLAFADSFGHDVETTYLLLETAHAVPAGGDVPWAEDPFWERMFDYGPEDAALLLLSLGRD